MKDCIQASIQCLLNLLTGLVRRSLGTCRLNLQVITHLSDRRAFTILGNCDGSLYVSSYQCDSSCTGLIGMVRHHCNSQHLIGITCLTPVGS